MNCQGPDILPGDRLQPDSLPDSGNRSVPHAAALFLLFAPGMTAGQVVDSCNGDFVFSGMNQIRNICAEGEIALFTGNCFRSVDADKRFPADRAEVEKDPLILPFFRQDETPGIDHFPAVFHLQVQTGKQAFRTEGNPDHCFGSGISKIPFPVQTQPVLPDHLRPRVGIPGNTAQGFSGGAR